jgi:hypothetical protein
MSSTSIYIQLRSSKFSSSDLGLIELSCLAFLAPRGNLLVPRTTAQGPTHLQGPRRGRRAGGTTTAH